MYGHYLESSARSARQGLRFPFSNEAAVGPLHHEQGGTEPALEYSSAKPLCGAGLPRKLPDISETVSLFVKFKNGVSPSQGSDGGRLRQSA